jgi:hypothetical protein
LILNALVSNSIELVPRALRGNSLPFWTIDTKLPFEQLASAQETMIQAALDAYPSH